MERFFAIMGFVFDTRQFGRDDEFRWRPSHRRPASHVFALARRHYLFSLLNRRPRRPANHEVQSAARNSRRHGHLQFHDGAHQWGAGC